MASEDTQRVKPKIERAFADVLSDPRLLSETQEAGWLQAGENPDANRVLAPLREDLLLMPDSVLRFFLPRTLREVLDAKAAGLDVENVVYLVWSLNVEMELPDASAEKRDERCRYYRQMYADLDNFQAQAIAEWLGLVQGWKELEDEEQVDEALAYWNRRSGGGGEDTGEETVSDMLRIEPPDLG